MSAAPPRLRDTARVVLAQAVRVAELVARRRSPAAEVGADIRPEEEPVHFTASERMMLPANDVAELDEQGGQVRVTANVLGLAGATPALPPVYSELQLQRRRQRDRSFAGFLNLFDHRALSFFYRIVRKYSWPVSVERTPPGQTDPISRAVLSLAGLGREGLRDRLEVEDGALVRLAAHLGDSRRSAASVRTVLRALTGLPVRIIEAVPHWIAVPPDEQTRLGGGGGRFCQLGGIDPETGLGSADAAMIGGAVMDVQHHFGVEVGPLDHGALVRFCVDDRARRVFGEACLLAAGMEHQPELRLLIRADAIPPLRLGDAARPALLGRTGWLGAPRDRGEVIGDCAIPIDRMAIGRGK
jgi:type VI secretion system protein ImpH